MYTKFYGFKERPFNVTPDTRFFYPSPEHKDALDSLYYAVTEKRGFAVLTGDIGTGKTTVWRTMLKRLEDSVKAAIITNSYVTGKQLVGSILEEMEVEYHTLSKTRMLSRLNSYLIEQFSGGSTVVFIIDEAQNLPARVLEEIRMLSNLETDEEKLLQIVLVGQPEFREKLMRPELKQLRQRVAVTVNLGPLPRDEMVKYIGYRVDKVSVGGHRDIFTRMALEKIYEYSRGVPRLVNSICDGALLSGYASGAQIIDDSLITEAVHDFLALSAQV